MAKRKFTAMVTPNTLETMIKMYLISSILNTICKMIKTPLEYPSMEIIKEKNNLTKQINRQHGNGECED
jgi:hypothetical protein